MKKFYKHEGKGFYIGSCVIARAENKLEAEKIIRKELDNLFLKDEELKIEEIKEINGIIYSNNGDY